MSGHDDIRLVGGGKPYVFVFDAPSATWWCGKGLSVHHDGCVWRASFVQINARVKSRAHGDPQGAFDELRHRLRAYAIAVGWNA